MGSDEDLLAQLQVISAECARLQQENARLKAALRDQSGEAAKTPLVVMKSPPTAPVTNNSPPDAKVALFRSLFRGREDVYALRWEGRNGRSGYSPACAPDWDSEFRGSKRGRPDYANRKLFPLTDDVIRNHLLGRHTVGVYPLLQDDTCWFVAADFDKKTWEDDASAFLATCRELGVPAALERSRSGNGAHVWIFFQNSTQAAVARKLGCFILTRTMERCHTAGLDSYDRFFPNQDTMPKGGFGNLIALPLQRGPRQRGNSVFLDDAVRPYPDQWEFLSKVVRLSPHEADALVRDASRIGDVIGVRMSVYDDEKADRPWTLPPSGKPIDGPITGPLPSRVKIVRGNLIYVEKNGLPPAMLNRLIRLAAFQNPEFYRAQAMRLSTFGKPRVIACAEDLTEHVGLPRGCLDEVIELFTSHGVEVDASDQRFGGVPIDACFCGRLRPQQKEAAKSLLAHDDGILSAPTAFGKTAVAAWLIAERKVNTLVLVHRRHLMDQWRERLAQFLDARLKDIGQIGGGKNSRTERLDVAVIQSLTRKGEVKDLVADYGQVIIDECHHVSAFTFERVLKHVKAKFVVGLTATPVRKDGHHPIILMQCGPIRFNLSAKKLAAATRLTHKVIPRYTEFKIPLEWSDIGIQDIYTALVNDQQRTNLVVSDLVRAISEGRSPLLLTERTDHVQQFAERLASRVKNIVVLKGGMGKKQRDALTAQLKETPDHEPRVIIATGRYIGEGFDDARLDTLFLAMPISWRGTLQQYVGRLHRQHANKRGVVVYDYVDAYVPMLTRMYEKRQKGYKAIGYVIEEPSEASDNQADLRFAEIERTAVRAVTAFEEARGCQVESVEDETRGFDLISRRLSPGNPQAVIEQRFIEVKGRAGVGDVALTANEYKTAERLNDDYWLYVVFNCASKPEVTAIQNPARLDWEPLSRIDCYRIGAERLRQGTG